MTTKTYRAVEQGFHLGRLIAADATFTVDIDAYEDETGDEFNPNWAVEIDDGHAPTPDNAGEQEALDGVLDRDAGLPKIAHPDQPLPQFHPALAIDTANEADANSSQRIALDQANAENGDKSVPVRTTADILAEQAAAQTSQPEQPAVDEVKPRRSRRRPNADAVATGTEPSDAEKAEAADASKAEKEAADTAEGEHEDGNDFV